MPTGLRIPLLSRVSEAYRSLKWRIVAALLFAALVPLLLVGFGSWVVFGDLLEQKSVELMRRSVEYHANSIDTYLANQRRLLQAVSENNDRARLADSVRLRAIFENLNRVSDRGFIDLGVIDHEGNHLAYVGPFDLMTRNYREADWFKEVLVRGQYVSDVFLGFRGVPHCIIAVRSTDEGRPWILRATINSAQFDHQVQKAFLADSSDVFIVNLSGLYQTTPRDGQLLDSSAVTDVPVFPGVRSSRLEDGVRTSIRVMTWLNDNRWLLVVQQDLAHVQAPVTQAIVRGVYVVLVAVVILTLTTVLATWHLSRLIDRATAGREAISRAFVRSAKLASVGELTTGLAHEINNPLAIISAEQTNIADILADPGAGPEDHHQAMASVKRCQAQVRRCAVITRKLLQFGRSAESRVEPVTLAPALAEIVALMERQASLRNISIELHVDKKLPPVLADAIEIEQVVVNLINNAFDAMPNGGVISIRGDLNDNRVILEVADSGMGIAPEHLDRVFEPFFTTKPVGKGTGLGLSVCYGIVRSWGADIEVSSQVGAGTAVRLILAYQQSDNTGQSEKR